MKRKIKIFGAWGGIFLALLLLPGLKCDLFKKPAAIVKDAINTTISAKSQHFAMEVNATTQVGTQPTNINLKLEGDSSKEPAAMLANFDGTIGVEGASLSAKGELRLLDNNLYAKIDTLPTIPGLPLPVGLQGQWIKIPAEDLEKTSGAQVKFFDPAQQVQIEQLLKDTDLFKDVTKEKDEVIDGVKTYHFKAKVDKEQLTKLLIEISKITAGQDASEKEVQSLKEGLNAIGDLSVDLNVGKSDHYLYRFKTDLVIPGETETKVSLTFKGSKYNEQVNIVAPEGAKSFEEVMSSFLGPMMPAISEEGTLPEGTTFPEGVELPIEEE